MAPPDVTAAIRKIHDFLTVGAPAPLQEGCAVALERLGDDCYADLLESYWRRRDVLSGALVDAGFMCTPPAARRRLVRFAFCKRLTTLQDAARRLAGQ